MNLFRTKTVAQLLDSAKKTQLTRSLTALDLILMGVGVIVGTGIFVFTGIGAAKIAGPALMLSFVLSGIACAFAALAYAELASMVPVSGSAYTYAYSALGEIVAWIVGWSLVLEYTVGAAAIASGWSSYVVTVIDSLGFTLPKAFTAVPADGGLINMPSILLVLFLTGVLYRGMRESAKFNRVLVIIKLCAVFVFIFCAAPYVNTANWTPFMPFGWAGVFKGASFAFFAYIGFDMVANSSEETRNPARDLPIGILGCLFVVTVLYIIVTGIMTGVLPYPELDTGAPVAHVLDVLGFKFGAAVVGTGVVFGLTSVVLVLFYSQTRLFYSMGRDGLLPKVFHKVHPKFHTPHIITVLTGIVICTITGFVKLEVLAELVNIGTLFAFVAASLGVLVLRITQPDLPRTFRCPAPYIIAPLSVISCGFLMYSLESFTWKCFLAWAVLGMIIYAVYGYKHSDLNRVDS
ncbi:MAG: amino acid permease [Negativicutes bacterium]|jgi:APA family basic amino acid/polyamine antiporter